MTSYYFGGAYETRSDGGIFKYYSFGGQSIVNEYKPATQAWTRSYLLTDHLSSVVAVTDGTGALISQQRYLPFGGERTNLGTISQTDYGYTGQRDLEMGLMDYKARLYSPLLGRFTQPDTITPRGPQGLNRYSYVGNNPINFNDPTGHLGCEPGMRCPIPKDKRDLTNWLVAVSVDIAESQEMQSIKTLNQPMIDLYKYGQNKASAMGLFESVVKTHAKYDVKDKILYQLGDTVKIGNNWYEFSTPGNILYGFYGKAAGFSDAELFAGAGIAQIRDLNDPDKDIELGPWLGDTSDDHAAIVFGVYLYNNYYKDDKRLTRADLLDALESYGDTNKMALRNKPKNSPRIYYDYPVNKFYNLE